MKSYVFENYGNEVNMNNENATKRMKNKQIIFLLYVKCSDNRNNIIRQHIALIFKTLVLITIRVF